MRGKYKKKQKKQQPVQVQNLANFNSHVSHPDIEQTGAIYCTHNYDLFNLLEENREVHINSKLYSLIQQQGQLTPIVVDEQFNVYDGQHRLAVLKKLNRPVIFVVNTNAKPYDMIAMNAAQRNWSDIDYINYYIKNNNENYRQLLDVYNRYRHVISLKTTILYLNNSSSGNNKTAFDRLKYGTYIIKDYNLTIQFLDFLERFKNETGLNSLRSWISDGLRKMYSTQNFDENRMIKKFNEKNLSNKPQLFASREQSLETLVLTYNDRLSESHAKYLNYEYNKNKNIVLV